MNTAYPPATHWIAADWSGRKRAIYGTGRTAEEAVSDARRRGREPESARYQTYPATARLVEAVDRDGGEPGLRRWWNTWRYGTDGAEVADLMGDDYGRLPA